MIVFYKNKKIKINVRKVSFFGKFLGLMFKSRNTDNLLFPFEKGVNVGLHSFFVFFSFLILFIDDKNRIKEYRIVKPFLPYVRARNKFRKVIELPLNNKNSEIIGFFVGKERFK